MLTKRCPVCENTFDLTPKYWYENKGRYDGFDSMCKICNRDKARERSGKRKEHKEVKTLDDERTLQGYNNLINEVDENGIDINQLRLGVGKTYKIKVPHRMKNTVADRTFIGELIQKCDKHYVFRNKAGRCESFLKVDLLIQYEWEAIK